MLKSLVKVGVVLGLLISSLYATPKYSKCVSCHGKNGEKVALGKSKIIKDMTVDEIVTALKGYKNGTYGGVMKSIMKGQVSSLSDSDINDIANHIGKGNVKSVSSTKTTTKNDSNTVSKETEKSKHSKEQSNTKMSYEQLRKKLNDVCSKIGGTMNSSGYCYIPSGDSRENKLKSMEKPYRNELYRALDEKYAKMDREQICKSVGGSKHSLGCWINNGEKGLQEDINNYLSERKIKRIEEEKAKLNKIFSIYADFPKEEALKYFTKKTGLYFIPTKRMLINWDESQKMCTEKGMSLVNSEEVYNSFYDVFGIYYRITNSNIYITKKLYTPIRDKFDYKIELKSKNGKKYKNIYTGGFESEGFFCKQLSQKDKDDLKEKLVKEKKEDKERMEKYGAKTYLEFFQKIVESKDNIELKYVYKYSAKNLNLRLGEQYAEFYLLNNGGFGLLEGDTSAIEYNHNRDWSKNIFKWPFKADAGERKSYMKGHNTAGITKNGLISFVNDLKKQPLFNVLKNKSEKSFRNGHAMIVSGEFKDKKGKRHIVEFVFRAKNYSVYIDVPKISY